MTHRRILALGWIVFLLYAYPGHMNIGALDMLIDSRAGAATDWHSPVMTYVWRVLNVVWTGPPSMLFLQSGLFLFGAYVLFARAMSERAAAICAASLLVFPPVMATMAVISEDALLAGFLVAAAAAFTSERRWVHGVGLFLAFLACGMRDGAWLAAGPIVVFGFAWERRRPWRYAIAANAWIAITLLAFGVTYLLTDLTTHRNEATRAVGDVSGMLARSKEPLDPEVQRLLPNVRVTPSGETAFDAPTENQFDAMIEARERLRDRDFGGWFATRWEFWQRQLRAKRVYIKDSVSLEFRIAAGHAARNSPVQKLLAKFTGLVARTPLFTPLVYLLIALLVLPFARRHAVFLASGIVLELSLFLTAYDIEARYSTWLIASTLIALVLVVKQRMQQRDRSA